MTAKAPNPVDRLNIVVAHMLEARPLIDLFQLKSGSPGPFKSWHNEQGVSLVLSGMGKLSAAAATAYLEASLDQSEQPPSSASAWLNIGIAGHRSAELGSGLLANRVIDWGSGVSSYPVPLLPAYSGATVITVDQPELEYPEDAAYDMEAAGFWAAASRLSTVELIQAYKIISDNPGHATDKVTPELIGQLFLDQRDQLQQLVSDITEMVAAHNQLYRLPGAFTTMQSGLHLTATQRSQLKRLCQRFLAMGLGEELDSVAERKHASARDLLLELHGRLEPAQEPG